MATVKRLMPFSREVREILYRVDKKSSEPPVLVCHACECVSFLPRIFRVDEKMSFGASFGLETVSESD